MGPDGIAQIRLEPTTRTGEVQLRLPLAGRTEVLRAWLEPEPRDWILVGLAEGTVGLERGLGQRREAGRRRAAEEFHHDGRVAFFARGRVKGRWLLTTAFDSRAKGGRPRPTAPCDGTIDPDAFYTVYGDASVQGHDAPPPGSCTCSLERREFFALFGDLATGLTVTELGRYNRRLTGAQAGYRRRACGTPPPSPAAAREHYGRDELTGRRHLGHLPPVAARPGDRLRDRDPRGARSLPWRGRAQLAAAEPRASTTTSTTAGASWCSRSRSSPATRTSTPGGSSSSTRPAGRRDAATTAGGRAAAHLAGDRVEIGVTVIHEGDLGRRPGGRRRPRRPARRTCRLKAEAAGSDRPRPGPRPPPGWPRLSRSRAAARRPRLAAPPRARLRPGPAALQAEDGTFMTGAEADWRPRTRLDPGRTRSPAARTWKPTPPRTWPRPA